VFEPVERSRAFERVVEQVERAIYSGELKPGDHLPSERQLVEQFQVGRSSVREALRILESMGLLRTLPGSQLGPQVSASGTAGLQRMLNGFVRVEGIGLGDLVQYRMISGSAANFLAAHLRTDEHLDQLRSTTREMEQTGPDDVERFAQADVRFHQIIADASGNALLTVVNGVIAQVIVDLMTSAIEHAPNSGQLRQDFLALHRELIDAIEHRDGRRASDLALRSLFDGYSPLLDEPDRARLRLLLPPPATD
jgi:GntR family transcriptional regulator, transcriptional repressor for pyruvate dehydrogenase complex